MSERTGANDDRPGPWGYAVVGGFVSVPLTVGLALTSGIGDALSLNAVVVGGFLAGVLARRRGAAVPPAGAGAGAIGGLVGVGWVLPSLLESAGSLTAAWSIPEAAVVLATAFAVSVLAVTAVVGLVGGVVGGWLYGLVAGGQTPVAAG